jgi:small subunit ribosomal protein S2
LSAISIKQLLEAGVHFGHQTSRWNPKMREYIFGERNGIHIIDLQKTLKLFKEAVDFLTDLGAQGKDILFVGTKRQAQEAVEEDAKGCGMHFVTNRWLGGLLTNFETVRNSIKRYKELEALKADGYYTRFSSKKEIAKLERERKKLEKNLRGIRNLDRLPDALFVIDSDREAIAVKEANRLGIPVIAVVDTNCDPDLVDFVIPGNDDALRSVKLFTSTIGDAVTAGRALWDAKVAEERRAREEAEREEAARAAAAKAAAEARRAEREKAAAEAAAQAKEAKEKEAKAAKAAKAESAAKAEAAAASEPAPAKAPAKQEQAAPETKPSAEAAAQPEAEQSAEPKAAAEDEKPAAEPVQAAEPEGEAAAVPEPEAEATAVAAEKESAGEKEAAPKKSGPRKSTQPKKAKAEGKASGGSSEDNTKEVAAES